MAPERQDHRADLGRDLPLAARHAGVGGVLGQAEPLAAGPGGGPAAAQVLAIDEEDAHVAVVEAVRVGEELAGLRQKAVLVLGVQQRLRQAGDVADLLGQLPDAH